MTVVADSGAIYALYDADDKHHASVRAAIEAEPGAIVLPIIALAELDYLLMEFLGVDAELDFLADLSQGAFALESVSQADLDRCREILSAYRDLKPGLVDASVVAVAERLSHTRILTVDERHFRVLQPRSGKPFTLLPADLQQG